MHLQSTWQSEAIIKKSLDDLTLGDIHEDNRYLTRDVPSILEEGLRYPIVFYVADRNYWDKLLIPTRDPAHRARLLVQQIPVDFINIVKTGNNRVQAAKYLGYSSIDCLSFQDERLAIQWGKFFAEGDPLKTGTPFTGKYTY